MTTQLNNIDCMDYMKRTDDNFFDLLISDPPYGLGIDGQKKSARGKKSDRKEHVFKNWDGSIPGGEYFSEVRRISKNQIIWGGNYFVEHLTEGHKGWIVWDKQQHGLTMSDCELAYSSFDKPTRVWKRNRVILQQEGGTIHPTQKPVALYKWLLSNYAEKGQKVIDTHLGSGSSAIAAHYFGCDFTGLEIDKDYFDAAKARFEKSTRQLTLF